MQRALRSVGVLIVSGAVAMVGLGAPAQAAGNGKIVFLSAYPRGDVSIVDAAAGSMPMKIGPGNVSFPAFAPDGSRIAAVSESGDLVTFGPDGAAVTTVASGASGDHVTPAWSPDATRLAYFTGGVGDGPRSLVISGATAGAAQQVVAQVSGYLSGSISWSPDGTTLLYSALDGIWKVAAAPGSTPTAVTIAGGTGLNAFGPSWSPDGTRFAFARECFGCDDPTKGGLWTSAADGSDPQQLVSAGITTAPSWSPDGTKIAFATTDWPNNAIRVATSTGAGQTGEVLVSAPGVVAPSWGGVPSAPQLIAAPVVTGTAGYGQKLASGNGTWAGAPTSYAMQWQRCQPGDPGSCANIGGATSPTYVVGQDDLGKALRSQVTASNAIGKAVGSSALVSVPKLPKGTNVSLSKLPKTLTVSKGKVKVPLSVKGDHRMVSANIVFRKLGKITKSLPKPVKKTTVQVKLTKSGWKKVKTQGTVTSKLTITLITKYKGSFYTTKKTITQKLQKA